MTHALAAATIASPGFDYAALAPILIIFVAALVSVILEAVLPQPSAAAPR